jgi:hypothetical protein
VIGGAGRGGGKSRDGDREERTGEERSRSHEVPDARGGDKDRKERL